MYWPEDYLPEDYWPTDYWPEYSATVAEDPCPAPPSVDQCPPKQVWLAGGILYTAMQLCDDEGTPVFVVYQLCDGVPSGAPTYYDLAGELYEPVLPLTSCTTGGSAASPVLIEAHHFDVTAGTDWDASTDIPTGTLVGLSYSIVEGTADVEDAGGTVIAGLPAGFSDSWNATDDAGELTPPALISANADSRVIVSMKVRP